MGTWTVTPSVDVEELPDGQLKVHFPDNPTTEEITYTIKYTPDGEGAKSCVRTVKQKGKEDKPIIYRNPDPTPNPDDDETTDFTFEDGCKENYQWIKVKTINKMTITSFSITPSGWGTIEPAPSGGYKTNQYYKMTFPLLLPGVSKELSISATVDGGKRTSSIKFNTTCSTVCSCSSVQFTKGSDITAAATSVVFGTYTMKNNCYADKVTIVKVSDEHDVVKWNTTGRTQQGSTYSLTAQTNPHTSISQDYEFSFKLKYDTTECSTYTLKQTHDVDCKCSCFTTTKPANIEYDRSERSDVTFGYIDFEDAACETSCIGNMTFVGGPDDGVYGIRLDNLGNLRHELKANIRRSTRSRKLSIDIMVGGEKCDTLGIYQRCWRGTDNGVDEFYGIDEHGEIVNMREEHPILLCGAEYYSEEEHKDVMPGDYDTIVVRDVEIECVCRDKNGNVVMGSVCKKVNHDGTIEIMPTDQPLWIPISEFDYLNDGPSLIFNDWLRVYWKASASYCSPYGSIATEAITEHTSATEAREVRFWLHSSHIPTEQDPLIIWTGCTCDDPGCKPQHYGEEACQTWEYPVFQAPRCYGWCKIGDNENRFAGIYNAGHSSCELTYSDKWRRAIRKHEKHDEIECHIDQDRFIDCRQ